MNLSLNRIKLEFVCPQKKTSRKVLAFIHRHFFSKKAKEKKTNSNPIIVWDIRSNPVTFDFVWLIFDIVNYLEKIKIYKFDLILYWPKNYVPIPMVFNNYGKYVTSRDISNRINDLILPLAQSFNCILSVKILQSENQLLDILGNHPFCIPENYHPRYYYPDFLDYARVFKILRSKKNVLLPKILNSPEFQRKKLLERYVTLTLRDYGFSPLRNTTQQNIDQFCCFAKNLLARPIIIPDDHKKLKEYIFSPETMIHSLSRENLEERICIYSNSLVNVFSPSGPVALSLFIPNTKSIVLHFGIGGYDGDLTTYKKLYALHVGDQPFHQLNGHILWHQNYPQPNSDDFMTAYKILDCQRPL